MICGLFGHTFRARYSEELPTGLTFKGKNPKELAVQIEASKIKIYEGDVCVSCGMTANVPYRPCKHTPLWSPGEKK